MPAGPCCRHLLGRCSSRDAVTRGQAPVTNCTEPLGDALLATGALPATGEEHPGRWRRLSLVIDALGRRACSWRCGVPRQQRVPRLHTACCWCSVVDSVCRPGRRAQDTSSIAGFETLDPARASRASRASGVSGHALERWARCTITAVHYNPNRRPPLWSVCTSLSDHSLVHHAFNGI